MRKRTLTTAAVAAALVGALGFAAPPAFAAGYGSVSASTSGDTVSIGNDAISRTFNIAGNKLKTGVIDNKLGKTQLTPPATGPRSSTSRVWPSRFVRSLRTR